MRRVIAALCLAALCGCHSSNPTPAASGWNYRGWGTNSAIQATPKFEVASELVAPPGSQWTNVIVTTDWLGCVMTSNNDPYTPSESWWPGFQIGLRSDGMVVWRKATSAPVRYEVTTNSNDTVLIHK